MRHLPPDSGNNRRTPPDVRVLLLLGGGLVLVVLAIFGVGVESDGASEPQPAAAIGAAGPGTAGQQRVTVQASTFAPGQKGGWHTHAGVHVVAVVAGSLTVYDSSCQSAVNRAGEAYVGGSLPHLAVNDTDEPVHILVTYVLEHAPAWEDLRSRRRRLRAHGRRS